MKACLERVFFMLVLALEGLCLQQKAWVPFQQLGMINLEVFACMLDAAKKDIGMNDDTVNIGFGDLAKLETMPAAHIVFTFWNTM